jgi:L-fuculose-phosphate aldolase
MESRLLEELCEVMRYAYVRGLISALTGNASVRLGPDQIAITPTGKPKFLLRPEDISIVRLSGEAVRGPKPSSEVVMHLEIYRVCGSCSAVVHVHGVVAPVLAGMVEPYIDSELKVYGASPCYVDELPPSSRELAEAVRVAVAGGCRVIVLKNHGLVGVGRNLWEALELVEAVENSFKRSLALYLVKTCGRSKD